MKRKIRSWKWIVCILFMLTLGCVGNLHEVQAATNTKSYIVSKKKIWKVDRTTNIKQMHLVS